MKMFMQIFVGLLLMCLLGCSCSDDSNRAQTLRQWMTPDGRIKVLSTIAMIDDLVKQVGGEYVDTSVLIKGDLDPHAYQLVKGDDEKLAFADLIFFSGLGLEHGPTMQSYVQKNPKVFALGDKIKAEDSNLILYFRGEVDPHIWMDISLWAKTVPFIVDALSQKDPAHAEFYQQNGKKLLQTMLEAHQAVKQEIQEIPQSKRYFVTSHDAFNYFTRAYLAEDGEESHIWQERFAAPEGLSPESQISTTDIQAIIEHLNRYNIRIIFPESNVNRDSIRKIVVAAKERGLNVHIADVSLYADAMGESGSEADSYLKMIQYNAKMIADHLKANGG